MRSRSSGLAATVGAAIALAACGHSRDPSSSKRPGHPDLLDTLAERCALVTSCADVHDASQFRDPAACVDWWLVNERAEKPLASCMMRATSCGEVHACTHARPDRAAIEFCLAHPGVFSACDGSRFIRCQGDEGRESTLDDCAALGGRCGESSDGGLVVRGCSSPRLCGAGAPERRCDRGVLVSCEDGIAEERRCLPGTTCVSRPDDNGTPSADCEAPGAIRCTASRSTSCQGDVAYACVLNGAYAGVHRTNCADFGLGCEVRSGRSTCVSTKASACAPGPTRCEDGSLVFCAAGREERVSCRALGLGACSNDAKGPFAACRTAD